MTGECVSTIIPASQTSILIENIFHIIYFYKKFDSTSSKYLGQKILSNHRNVS